LGPLIGCSISRIGKVGGINTGEQGEGSHYTKTRLLLPGSTPLENLRMWPAEKNHNNFRVIFSLDWIGLKAVCVDRSRLGHPSPQVF